MGKLNVLCGNVLDYIDNMEAIVNSNNQYMICGSGVCGLIYKNADKDKLEEYCRNNFNEQMKVNEVRITPGFNLGLDIIHIYCPKAYQSKEPIKDLLKGYESIFIKAKERNYKDIVSVSLGTGIHGYKHNEVSKDVVNKLNKLVGEYDINFNLILLKDEEKKLYDKFDN